MFIIYTNVIYFGEFYMKEDLRVKKTKSALRKAFSNLLKTKSFNKITIMEICETAMVNRVTFYSHYKDKQSLFMDYVHFVTNKIIEKCYLVAKPYEGAQRAIIFFNELFKELFECLSHSDEAQYLNTIEDKFYFIYDTQHQASILVKKYMTESKVFKQSRYSTDTILAFLFGATSNMARNYSCEENPSRKAEIKEQFKSLIENFIKGII